MNFSSLKVSDTGVLKLRHPLTGEVIEGAEIVMLGRDSKAFRNLVYEQAKLGALSEDVKANDERNLERCCTLVVSISGIEEDGVPITDPMKLFTGYPWALEQAQVFILNRANFIQPA